VGREIKRVPVGFDWPLRKVWGGYLDPWWEYRRECILCQGEGYSPQARDLKDQWYGKVPFVPQRPFAISTPVIRERARRNVDLAGKNSLLEVGVLLDILIEEEAMRLAWLLNSCWVHHLDEDDVAALLEADRLWDFTRTPRTPEEVKIVEHKQAEGGNSWLPESNGYVPSPEEVNIWSISGSGHDSINSWICVKAKAKRLGYPLYCSSCEGSGDDWESEVYREASEAWERVEPPEGEGWQMWETVSEGSPVSPVFDTAEGLENWLIEQGYSEGAAEQFVKVGWVPSMVMHGEKVAMGIETLNMAKG
jgi:hypothetical protein